jgi:hemolysin III
MIFFLIAGTATPACSLAMRGGPGLACLITIWALTLTAAAIHLTWMPGPERLIGAMFPGLGWLAGLALPEVWIHAGAAPGALMLAGGLLYTAGRSPATAAGSTGTRPSSATTRSFTSMSVPRRRASS